MKKRKKGDGSNTGKGPGRSIQGTGKTMRKESPENTHLTGGAIRSPKKAKGPLDNRGPAAPTAKKRQRDTTHRVGPY